MPWPSRALQQYHRPRQPKPIPLPANTVEWWDSLKGVALNNGEVVGWLGQKLGLQLVPTTTAPLYGRDAGWFEDRHVVQCTKISNTLMRAPGTSIGTLLQPWVYVVHRNRVLASTSVESVFGLGRDAIQIYTLYENNAIGMSSWYKGLVATSAPRVTEPRRVFAGRDGGGNLIAINGAVAGSSAAGTDDPDVNALGVGRSAHDPNASSNASIALIILCSSKPTPAEITALHAWQLTPPSFPLPASTWECWDSRFGVSGGVGLASFWHGSLNPTAPSRIEQAGGASLLYAVDGAHFAGRPVVQSAIGKHARRLGSQGPLMFDSPYPWIYAVVRLQSVPASPVRQFLLQIAYSGTQAILDLYIDQPTGKLAGKYITSGVVLSAAALTTSAVVRVAVYRTATEIRLRLNGVEVAAAAPAPTLPEQTQAGGFGLGRGYTASGDNSVASYGFVACGGGAVPLTATELAVLDAMPIEL